MKSRSRNRDQRESGPAPMPYRLESVVEGVASDLEALRAGSITIEDARARALLAKQYIAGLRVILQAQRFLSEKAKDVAAIPADMEAI